MRLTSALNTKARQPLVLRRPLPRMWLWVTYPWRPTGTDSWWTCAEGTRNGDLALLYRTSPVSAVVELLEATSPARSITEEERGDENWRWVCDYQRRARFTSPLTHADIRADPMLDEWRRSCGNFRGAAFAVPSDVAEELMRRLRPSAITVAGRPPRVAIDPTEPLVLTRCGFRG